ncbi:ferrichrome-binding protein [Halopelagius inordinatus]|uniref:Ferrichrome-binding protein n=1 Tax=Halopelagius inordinatus TaxID=553467 RepID=A0A1I2MHR3_9EURY|nr:ABC transporter substrate-binding protein [Halopelagius inordinatus]SFF90982.1 ferrichrome-binding protein [Halopelagius inordinatus]
MRDAPTRRTYLRRTAALAGAGLVAGCTGDGSGDGPETESEPGEANAATETTEAKTEAGESSHSASMKPMGTVEFDGVPERVFTVFPQYADMAVALGHGDAVNSVYVPEMSGTTMNHYYHHLEGVSFEWEGLSDPLAEGLRKELLFELDSDVHLADPAWASTQDNWDEGDVDEVSSQIGPWFGNFYSGTHAAPPEGFEYDYYTLWEMFGNVADVFGEREKYEALADVHEELVSSIRDSLPPKEDRPTAVRVTLASNSDSFYTYHLNKPGYWLADTRPLGANDAFAEKDWSSLWGTVDYETMLEADPDVILHLWGTTPNYNMEDTIASLKDHPVGSQLTAVQNDRVYPAGMRYQGPIMNLFQLEMGAKQLYPEQFGEWPGYENGQPYPEVPDEEQLFDRQRVADAIRGDI